MGKKEGRMIRICHLYPEVLNLYGDRGNVLCMKQRLLWRGIGCEVDTLGIGEKKDIAGYDLFFMGGGQDFDEEVLLADLRAGAGGEIRAAVRDGKTFLCICGGYQILGNYYETQDGKKCEFLGAVDFHTVGRKKRLIGNYAFCLEEQPGCGEDRFVHRQSRGAEEKPDGASGQNAVVGFENHSGRTYLGEGISPLGRVLAGYGNNGEDGTEGVRCRNVYGTYSHGPVLPKNPFLCDRILLSALERKYGSALLEPLDDRAEQQAHDSVFRQIMRQKGRKVRVPVTGILGGWAAWHRNG